MENVTNWLLAGQRIRAISHPPSRRGVLMELQPVMPPPRGKTVQEAVPAPAVRFRLTVEQAQDIQLRIRLALRELGQPEDGLPVRH
jgi:hypothetical protein